MFLHQIHHVAIIASDYEKSKYFYTTILQLPILAETYRAHRHSYKLDLQLGSNQIELFSFPQPPQRPSTPEAAGLRHLAFDVSNLDAVIA
ncbi:MAG: VOC family protein, partial [Culicoidibacterales bacterium]